MRIKKKIVLGLSVLFSFLMLAVIAVANNYSRAVPVQGSPNDKYVIITSEDTLEFEYKPEVEAQASSTKVYKYTFSNLSTTESTAIKLIDELSGTNLQFKYASTSDANAVLDNLIKHDVLPIVENVKNGTSYVYIFVTVVDDTQPATLITDLDWYYGKLGQVKYSINGQIKHTENIIKNVEIAESHLTTDQVNEYKTVSAYTFGGWYMDANYQQPATFPLTTGGATLYAKMDWPANYLPTDWFKYNSSTGTYQVVKGKSTLPQNVTIPEKYNDGTNGLKNVTIIAEMAFQANQRIESVALPNTLTTISGYAFRDCTNLRSVSFNSTPVLADAATQTLALTTIGTYAFKGCSNLTTIDFTKCTNLSSVSTHIFYECANLTNVDFSKCTKVTYIGGASFAYCVNLNSIALPTNLTEITETMFQSCKALTSISLPSKLEIIGKSAFYGSGLTSLSLPSSVKTLREQAFMDCPNLTGSITLTNVSVGRFVFNASGITGLTIGAGVTWSDEAFAYAKKLETVTISGSGYTIPRYLFRGCESFDTLNASGSNMTFDENAFYGFTYLKNLNITGSNTKIGQGAFYGCTGLTSINLPSKVTALGDYAFDQCSGAETITVSAAITKIPNFAFRGCTGTKTLTINGASIKEIGNEAFRDYTNLTKVTISSSLTTMGTHVFYGDSALVSISLPNTIISIGGAAFAECTALTTINIPTGVTAISESMFSKCTSLQSVTLPSGIKTIETLAFYDSGLTGITLPSGLTTIGDKAFMECGSLTSATIPASVTTYGDDLFNHSGVTELTINSASTLTAHSMQYMPNLTTINLNAGMTVQRYAFQWNTPNSVTLNVNAGVTFGPNAFYGQYQIGAINFDENAKGIIINQGAFYECRIVESLILTKGIDYIGSYAFQNAVYSSIYVDMNTAKQTNIPSYAFAGFTAVGSVTIAEGITSIDGSAFRDCVFISELSLPSTLTSVGAHAFYNAISGFGSVSVDLSYCTNLTTIGGAAFSYCTALTSVKLPKSLTAISEAMFSGCTSLGGTMDLSNTQVTSVGNMAFYSCPMTTILFPETITSIGSRAFYGCRGLQYASKDGTYIAAAGFYIPATVNYIGANAFSCCDVLAAVFFEHSGTWTLTNGANTATLKVNPTAGTYSNYYYQLRTSYVQYTWTGGGVQVLGDSWFRLNSDNTGYTVVYGGNGLSGDYIIPARHNGKPVTAISEETFKGASLTSITIPSTITTIGAYAFESCSLTSVTIPDSITTINEGAFVGCTSLTSVTIPSSVTSIGVHAFNYCISLTSITIPSSVTSIGNSAFYSCPLTSVTFEENSQLTSIGDTAFAYCESLNNITIPASVISIGERAFHQCDSLTSAIFENPIGWETYEQIDSGVLANPSTAARCLYATYSESIWTCTPPQVLSDSSWFELNADGLGYTVKKGSGRLSGAWAIPATYNGLPVTAIADGNSTSTSVFYAQRNVLRSITIPSSITSIGNYAFYGCTGLTSIIIPEGVISIGDYAFAQAKNLTTLTISSSVTRIGIYAFQVCRNLTSTTFEGLDGYKWYTTRNSDYTEGSSMIYDLSDTSSAGMRLYMTYLTWYWYKKAN